jgi:AcrR family transcriptional regulator
MTDAASREDLVRRVLDSAQRASEGLRRDNGREVPLGPKAARTRDALLTAAYELFVERGYRGTAVGDIAERAGVSLGTFYQYFRDRADVMGTLVSIGVLELLRGYRRRWDPTRGRLGLRRVIASFVEAYVQSARFQAVWEEVTHVDEGMAALRRDQSRLFVFAVEEALAEGIKRGVVRSDVDPPGMARALTAMVDRHCYMTYVFDPSPDDPPSVDDTVDLLTALWADAIGLVESGGRPAAQ